MARNFSSAPVKLFSKEAALSEHAATAEADFIRPLQHTASVTTVGLNLKAVPVISAPVSLRSDATVRQADAENQGSLISRNVMENKGNFPACVYIKANVKRVYIFGADPSSAARAGLSDGTQRGFMASRPPLQQDARIQTRILHSYPDDAKTQEVEWDLRRTGGRNWLGGSHFAPVCLHKFTLVQVGERREGG